MKRLGWLIVGGGLHGVHVAARLIGEAGVRPEQLCLLDPEDDLLSRWRACSATTGMTHLRSTSVHHLDLDPAALRRFAEERGQGRSDHFAAPYLRPSLDLFNAHCDRVIDAYGLRACHLRGRAVWCRVECDGVTVGTEGGETLIAEHLVLAMGSGERPLEPSWALRDEPRLSHIFARGFSLPPAGSRRRFAVVGGGISAAQVALRLERDGHQVHLVSRHAPRLHQFDSDPGWLGPRYLNRFDREGSSEVRRAMITRARHRGSIPPDVARALERSIGDGGISWHWADVAEVVPDSGVLRLRLSSGDELAVERVALATGFSSKRPGGSMIDDLVETASLPCARCGYPIVDSTLRWHSRIYVTGPLAELELGPASRNISGARRAGERIAWSAKQGGSGPRNFGRRTETDGFAHV